MACLLFSTVKINFMPQFIPVFAASKAFKSYLAAWLCSVPRLHGPFGSPVSAGFEQTWLILYATSAAGSKAPLSGLFQRLDLPLMGPCPFCVKFLLCWSEGLCHPLVKKEEGKMAFSALIL